MPPDPSWVSECHLRCVALQKGYAIGYALTTIGMRCEERVVTWIDGAIANPRPAALEKVLAAENELRVDLPADFLAVAATYQGAAPSPSGLKMPDGTVTSVAHLFHFEDSPFTSNILAAGFPWQDSLDKGVIPFAADILGDLFCFNYRADYDHPPVAYFSVDAGLVPLAANFTAFVAMLDGADGS